MVQPITDKYSILHVPDTLYGESDNEIIRLMNRKRFKVQLKPTLKPTVFPSKNKCNISVPNQRLPFLKKLFGIPNFQELHHYPNGGSLESFSSYFESFLENNFLKLCLYTNTKSKRITFSLFLIILSHQSISGNYLNIPTYLF